MDTTTMHRQQRLAHDDGVEDAQDGVSGVRVSLSDTLGAMFLALLR